MMIPDTTFTFKVSTASSVLYKNTFNNSGELLWFKMTDIQVDWDKRKLSDDEMISQSLI